MSRKTLILLAAVASVSAPLFAQETVAPPAWPEITHVTKPWARWWWLGSAVDEKNLTSEMEAYAQAGLGGLELTPIYGVRGEEDKFIPYLSPHWVDMLAYTLKEAKRLDLGVDMATGTGWPFGGGPLIGADAACQELFYLIYKVNGGDSLHGAVSFTQAPLIHTDSTLNTTVDQLVEPVFTNKNLQALALDQVRFPNPLPLQTLMAYSDSGAILDLTGKVRPDGTLDWVAPAGNWTLYALFPGPHGKMVERAAPGGEGNVVDHFSATSMRRYFSRFDEAFAGRDLAGLRAFFNDSYEVDDSQGNANWTPNFLTEFQTRRGYDLRQHLPALFGRDTPDLNARVLSDFRETISDLLLDDFTTPWRQWARTHGAVVRDQAHGSPASILDLYAAADIPETEGQNILSMKFATSAAHVSGKQLASSESATWLKEHFQATLGDVRQAVDRFFLSGVNHIFYHGTAYSPADAPWPGWLFYAAVEFNPRNPFWTDFGALNHYVARVQSFLQKGHPDNNVLLYYPIYDALANPGADAVLEHFNGPGQVGGVFTQLASEMQQRGYTFDYISDRQIGGISQSASALLETGGTAYQVIVVPSCKYMPFQTFNTLALLANGGATVIFCSDLPKDTAGFSGLALRRNFQQRLEGIKFNSTGTPGVEEAKMDTGRFLRGGDLAAMLAYAGVTREPMVEQGLQFTRRNYDNGKYYFITNAGNAPVNGWVPLQTAALAAALFDPMQDRRGYAQVRPSGDHASSIYLQLPPGESCVVQTFDTTATGAPFAYYQPLSAGLPLSRWDLEFVTGGPALPPAVKEMPLASWTSLDGDAYKIFSGTARYTMVMTGPQAPAPAFLLNLGQVRDSARVRLNGRDLGTLIGPNFQITFLSAQLKPGDNTLEVFVSNSMANRIIDLDRRGVNYKKFYNTNFPAHNAQNREPDGLFSAAGWSPMPSGLLGPVTLTPLELVKFP